MLRPGAWAGIRALVLVSISNKGGDLPRRPDAHRAAANARPAQLRLTFASRQQYEQGYYTAYRHMAAESLDLVVHLGDYIYESSWGQDFVRRHAAPEPRTLIEYRNRHAQYRTDPDCRQYTRPARLLVWDDHEVDSDYANERSEDLNPKFLSAGPPFIMRISSTCRCSFHKHPATAVCRCMAATTLAILPAFTSSMVGSTARRKPVRVPAAAARTG